MNFNTKVTIQKEQRSEYTRYLGTESKGRAHFLMNLSILFVLTNIDFSLFHT